MLSDIVYICDVGIWCLDCLDLEAVAKEEDAVGCLNEMCL